MIASSTARVAAMRAANAAHRDAVDVLGQRHQLSAQAPALRREEDVDLLAVAAELAAA